MGSQHSPKLKSEIRVLTAGVTKGRSISADPAGGPEVTISACYRPYFERYQRAVETEVENGVPQDVVFGPIPYHAYFVASGALLKIDGSPEYERAIRKYLDHSNEQVRWWAERALQGDDLPTA